MAADLAKVLSYIDAHEKQWIGNLKEAVEVKNVSAWKDSRGECLRMVEYTVKRLKALNFTTEVKDVGMQTVEDGSKIQLPPVIFATLGNDPKKLNLLIYGHLDVQPAKMSDGWNPKYEPFTLTEDGLNLYGRGSTDDKGPVLGWLHCVEAYQKSGVALPVNIKMVLESMEECGSEGLEELLEKEKNQFLKAWTLSQLAITTGLELRSPV